MNEENERKYLKNIGVKVKLSSLILKDKAGEIVFIPDPPCPRCDFWMNGEYAGAFQCEVCGHSEVPEYSSKHGYHLLLEGIWTILRKFLPYKRLRWEVSAFIYKIYSKLDTYQRLSKHQTTIVVDDYMWDWNLKKWIKFME